MLSKRRKVPGLIQEENRIQNKSTTSGMSRPTESATVPMEEEAENQPIPAQSMWCSYKSRRNKNILKLLLSFALATGVIVILVATTHPHFENNQGHNSGGDQKPLPNARASDSILKNHDFANGQSASYQPFERTIRVACAGDSLTLGEIGTMSGEDYPSQLQQLLGDAFKTHNYGVNSATAIRGLNKSYSMTQAFQDSILDADIYLLMLGTNDAKFWAKHSQEFGTDMKWMIDQTIRRRVNGSAPATRVMLAIPPWVKGDNGGIKNEVLVRRVQPAIRQFATTEKLQLVDMYTPTLNQGDFYISDKLHLNAKGYQRIAQAWKTAIECNHNNVCNIGENCKTCPEDCRSECT